MVPDRNAERDITEYLDAELEECAPKVERPSWAELTLEQEPEHEAIYDDLIGKMLEYDEAAEARFDEIEALRRMGVWEVAPISQCSERTGRRKINSRWVDINKGDNETKNDRSRYVAMEVRRLHGGAQRGGRGAGKSRYLAGGNYGHVSRSDSPQDVLLGQIKGLLVCAGIGRQPLCRAALRNWIAGSMRPFEEGLVWNKGSCKVLGGRVQQNYRRGAVLERSVQSMFIQTREARLHDFHTWRRGCCERHT